MLALVDAAIKHFAALLFTLENGARGNIARHILDGLTTMTLDLNRDVARGTGTRMAKQIASIMLAVLVLGLVAVLATRVWQN